MIEEQNGMAAWQSKTNIMAFMALVAFAIQHFWSVTLPIEIQGYTVDVVQLIVPAFLGVVIWVRNKAKNLINRWF